MVKGMLQDNQGLDEPPSFPNISPPDNREERDLSKPQLEPYANYFPPILAKNERKLPETKNFKIKNPKLNKYLILYSKPSELLSDENLESLKIKSIHPYQRKHNLLFNPLIFLALILFIIVVIIALAPHF